MSLKRLSAQKKQNLGLDGARPLQSRHSGLGAGGPQWRNIQAVVEDSGSLEVLLLCDRWLEGVSQFHSSRRPNCEQDLHDKGGGREYSLTSLSSAAASQDALLLQVRGYAEVLSSLATALLKVLGCPAPQSIHTLIQQRPLSKSTSGFVAESTVLGTG